MILQLTGKNEPEGLYKEFYGRIIDQMPLLIAQGYEPISIAGTIDRRLYAPDVVRNTWRRNYVFTGDGVSYGTKGDVLVILSAQPLRGVTLQSQLCVNPLVDWALQLNTEQWEDLKKSDSVLYLPANKVEQVDGKGFVKRGVWQPENAVVGEVWEHLGQGNDLEDYAQMISEAEDSNSKNVMNLYFDRSQKSSPTLRPWVLESIDGDSDAHGDDSLGDIGGHLIGVSERKIRDTFPL